MRGEEELEAVVEAAIEKKITYYTQYCNLTEE